MLLSEFNKNTQINQVKINYIKKYKYKINDNYH